MVSYDMKIKTEWALKSEITKCEYVRVIRKQLVRVIIEYNANHTSRTDKVRVWHHVLGTSFLTRFLLIAVDAT